MNISIIGASTGIGLETVKRALDRGHSVTTLSRSMLPLPENPRMKSIQGSALKKEDLLQAIEAADAVLVTLGTRKNRKATTLFSDFAKLLVDTQAASKTEIPIVVVTGFGAGDSRPYLTWVVKILMNMLLKDVYVDKTKMEEIIAASDLNWCIVRPGRLLNKPLTEKYRTETKLYKGINIGGINRADVADYIVKQAENPSEIKKYVAIAQK